MTPLQERLQREAAYMKLNGKSNDFIISHTISETIKEAVRVIEGKELPTLESVVPEFKQNKIYNNGYNNGLSTAITAVEGLGKTDKQ